MTLHLNVKEIDTQTVTKSMLGNPLGSRGHARDHNYDLQNE